MRPADQLAAASLFPLGACFVVLGGLVAAVTQPLALEHGSWLAAYLVLVCGVAQCAAGMVRYRLGTGPVVARRVLIQLIGWNVGNAAVITGTLLGAPFVVDGGGALLLAALLVAGRDVRDSSRRPAALVYRLLLAMLVISIPVGLALAHLRAP